MSTSEDASINPGASPIDLQPRQPEVPSTQVLEEDPSWNGWDILLIIVLTTVCLAVFAIGTTLAAQQFLYPKLGWRDVAQFPLVTVFAQLLAYVVVLAFMVSLARRRPDQSFWSEIRWNWPENWLAYLVGGVVLSVGLQLFAHLLPMPKEVPMDRFFQTARQAWALSIFGATVAPLMEELFFRGFLYPVLTRKLGMQVSVVLTALAFGAVHAPQFGTAWGPVLLIFLVGLALTITRAVTKSVAAGLLIHAAYNTTIFALMLVATDGFRHLEKLNQP